MSKDWKAKAAAGLIEVRELELHRVRIYKERLAISRNDGQRMTWEELQEIKQLIWGDAICVEVYPAADAVVNLRHTRHLWSSPSLTAAVIDSCRHPEFDNASAIRNQHKAKI